MAAAALMLGGCGGPQGAEPFGIGGSAAIDGGGESVASSGSTTVAVDATTASTGAGASTDDGDAPDTNAETSAGDMLDACTYASTSFGEGWQELDVPTGSGLRLTFVVPGLPDPALIETATLRFSSYDADHPGEEGVVYVGASGLFDVPANPAWDNVEGSGVIDITGAVVEGTNTIEFGAGSLQPRSFFRIADVAIDVDADVDDCEPATEAPQGNPVPRQVDYQDAAYTMRHNWVLRCDDYAYTAFADEHIDADCDGLYAPDGSRRGTATFDFDDVEPGTYEIQIRSRHTENRNPQGALFVVNGEGKRIDQRDDADYTTDLWGTRDLAGDVTVVLDSSQESQSDSVIWVRLEPT